MLNPYLALDPDALAQTCEARMQELQACAWSTPAERDALREQTALLLDAAARRLTREAAANTGQCPAHAFQLRDFLGEGDHALYLEALCRVSAQLRGGRPFAGAGEDASGL